MSSKIKYIKITSDKDCSGCGACKVVCPVGCITMDADSMGFRYPKVDTERCIKCGACVKVCPFAKSWDEGDIIKSFAVQNKDNAVRMESSSGGVFKALARTVISMGGVVFGAVYDVHWNVIHVKAENDDEVRAMMGSKYVESDTLNTYHEAKVCLLDGKPVLYTGTPCQIAGLKHYLKKDYSNLLAVEVICHGVPSAYVWQSYLSDNIFRQLAGNGKIEDIKFRDKSNGWKNYSLGVRVANSIKSNEISVTAPQQSSENPYRLQPYKDNPYMAAFLRDWSLRPSCYACKCKSGKSHADLTIGDFWKFKDTGSINDDDKGVSCAVCRSERGMYFMLNCTELKIEEVAYKDILRGNTCIEKSVGITDASKRFHRLFPDKGFSETMYRIEHPSIMVRGISFLKRKLKRYGL
ncbi:MAG: 4Fe-4S binding protein [Muribaculaceae bacterium]|nr:4Fe-4S binding protein [Muribaculaceae bacterium]